MVDLVCNAMQGACQKMSQLTICRVACQGVVRSVVFDRIQPHLREWHAACDSNALSGLRHQGVLASHYACVIPKAQTKQLCETVEVYDVSAKENIHSGAGVASDGSTRGSSGVAHAQRSQSIG